MWLAEPEAEVKSRRAEAARPKAKSRTAAKQEAGARLKEKARQGSLDKERNQAATPSRENKLALAAPAKPARRVDCKAAGSTLGGYGFSEVMPKSCEGERYVYEAKRDGDSFSVSLNATDGELANVSKMPPSDPEQWVTP